MNSEEPKIRKNDVAWHRRNTFVAIIFASRSLMFSNKAIIFLNEGLYRKVLALRQGLLSHFLKMAAVQ